MEQTSTRPTLIGPTAALALAVGAAVSFGAGDAVGFHSDSAESVSVLMWLVGWVLLTWAVLLAGGSLVALLRRALARRPATWSELVLLSAGIALIVLVVSMHPLWGSGSAG